MQVAELQSIDDAIKLNGVVFMCNCGWNDKTIGEYERNNNVHELNSHSPSDYLLHSSFP